MPVQTIRLEGLTDDEYKSDFSLDIFDSHQEQSFNSLQQQSYLQSILIPLRAGSEYTVKDEAGLVTDNVAVEFDADLMHEIFHAATTDRKCEDRFLEDWDYACYLNFSSFVIPLPFEGGETKKENVDDHDGDDDEVKGKVGKVGKEGKDHLLLSRASTAFAALLRRLLVKSNSVLRLVFKINILALEGCEMWSRWTSFRQKLGNIPCELALEVCPSISTNRASLLSTTNLSSSSLWMAENVAHICLHSNDFITNAKGYPVLTKTHQAFLAPWLKMHKINLILTVADEDAAFKVSPELAYLSHLQNKALMGRSKTEMFVDGYQDVLQFPLQPLMDNLESGTYQVFEHDPVKYEMYEEAIYLALLDKKVERSSGRLVITVAGSGRGPIVRRALEAAKRAEISDFKIFALEKNHSAYLTLVNLKKREWLNEPIEVIEGDMRAWRPKEEDLADILVSELLGSFGDNELSPECLDGGMHLIRPDDGISIPSSYTSYACPVMTSKLFQKVSQLKQGDSGGGDKREKNFSTPYVVYLQNCLPLSPAQPIFTFHHARSSPSSSPSSHSPSNERFGQFEFHVEGPVGDLQCHGFVGYFKAVLYKHIVLSTVPEDHTPDMFSWFPIYFPIESELRVRSSSEKICLSIWRRVDSRQVWYEWCLENTKSYATTRIHNSGGQSYWIGL